MKIQQPATQQGSFGLTPEMRDTVDAYQKKKHESAKPVVEENEEDSQIEEEQGLDLDGEMAVEASEVVKKEDAIKPPSPIDTLAKLGVELTDNDYHSIIFRGYLEKDIMVVSAIGKNKPLVATFRTLSGKEVDQVDELLAGDIEDGVKMTNDGYSARRSMWVLAFGVSQLLGKPVCTPVASKKDKTKVDIRATAAKKREVLSTLSPAVLVKMMNIHSTLTLSINSIISNPEADYLKK